MQLDHLTRGRAMLGVGPGALPGDAYMLNIEPTTQRPRMDEALGVIIQLLTSDEPVSYECEWFTLREGRLQLKPYQRPTMPIAVASTLSPAGMQTAGKHGAGVLSVASYSEKGLTALQTQWSFAEEAAAKAGKPAPDRKNWRIVMPFHLAETREQAIADIEEGIMSWNNDYFVGTIGAPNVQPVSSGREAAERLISLGGIIGTPDEAVESIRRLQEVSGGFGCLLGLAHEWADREKTLRSYELMARYVMPRGAGHRELDTPLAGVDRRQQGHPHRRRHPGRHQGHRRRQRHPAPRRHRRHAGRAPRRAGPGGGEGGVGGT